MECKALYIAFAASINRNIMECKDCSGKMDRQNILRINRNIMECKDLSTGNVHMTAAGINRNIMECKAVILSAQVSAIQY